MANNLDLALRIQAQVTGTENIDRINDALSDQRLAALQAASAAQDLSTAEGQAARIAIDAAIASERQARALEQQARQARAAANALSAIPNQTQQQQMAAAAASAQATALEQQAAAARASATALGQQAAAANQASQANTTAGNSAQNASAGFQKMAGALASVIAATLGIGKLVEVADGFKLLEARVTNMTAEMGSSTQAMEDIRAIANEVGSSLDSVAAVYGKVAQASKELGLSQTQVAEFTQSLAQSFAVSGASAAETDGALRQLGQALSSGVLRGDEFNSIMEQAPRIQQALADSLGVSKGELRAMAEQGKLTADVVTKAMLEQSQKISQEFGKLPDTVGVAWQAVTNEFVQFVAGLNEGTGATASIASALRDLQSVFAGLNDNMGTTLKVAGMIAEPLLAAFGAMAVASVVNYTRSLVAATAAAGGTAAAVARIPTVVKIGLVFAGLDILKQVAFELGELAGKYSEAGRSAEAAAAKQKQAYVEQRAAALGAMDALEQTKNTTVLTAQEFARLGEDGKAAYLQSIKGAIEYNQAALKAAYASSEIGEKTTVSAAEAAKGLAQMKAALAQAEQGAKLTSKEIEAMLSLKAERLLADFDALGVKAGEAAKAVGQISESLNFKNTTDVQAFGQLLDELKTKGKLSAEEVKTAWQDALKTMSGEELGQFAITLQAAFGDSERDVRAFAVGLETSLNQAFKNLGLEASNALGQIDQASRDAAGSVDFIRASLEIMSDTGINKAQALEQALTAAVGKQNTAEGLDRIAKSLEDMGKKGDLSTEALTRVNAEIAAQKLKIDEATPGINSLAEAYKTLGITAPEALKKTADEAKSAFDMMVQLKAPTADIQAAFVKYAEAAIKANGGVADSALLAKAQQLGLKDAVIGLEQAAIKASPAMKSLEEKYNASSEAAKQNTDAVKRSADAHVAAAKAALDNAKAKGDENEISRAAAVLAQAEADAAYALAQAKYAEAEAAAAYAEEVARALVLDGAKSEADERAIAAAQAKAAALRGEADAQAMAAGAAQDAANAAEDAASKTVTATNTVVVASNNMSKSVGSSWQSMAQEVGISADQMQKYGNILVGIYDKAAEAQKNWLAQGQRGGDPMAGMERSLLEAAQAAQFLDDKIAQLKDTGSNSNASLLAENLELKGQYEQAAKVRESALLNEIELNIQLMEVEAQKAALEQDDAAYQAALKRIAVLKEELSLTKENIELKKKADAAESPASATQKNSSSSGGSGIQPTTQTVKVVDVKFGTKTVRVIAGDEDKLLDAIKTAGLSA